MENLSSINFPYKMEKNRAFPGQPHGKTEILHKTMIFPHRPVKRVKKYLFNPFLADLAPTVADELVLRATCQEPAAHLPPK